MDDKQLEQLLAELKRNEDSTMTKFKRALLAMQNIDDVAILDVVIGDYKFRLPLLIEELHWGFVRFLEDCINMVETVD